MEQQTKLKSLSLKSILFLFLVFSYLMGQNNVLAVTIAIIDSGTDYHHQNLVNQFWNNPVDNTTNGVDEDKNGKVDDLYGWNFAENNWEVIDYRYSGIFSQNVLKFFEIQGKMMEGAASEKEKNWVKEKLTDKLFVLELQTFANFVHGTHVAGIAAKANDNDILAIKLIPTSIVSNQYLSVVNEHKNQINKNQNVPKKDEDVKEIVLKMSLDKIATEQSTVFIEIGDYLAEKKVDVANGSFGTGTAQAAAIVTSLYNLVFGQAPNELELKKYSKYFLQQVLNAAQTMVDKSPKTVFVFAAGNEANDNDVMPTSPASIRAKNVVTVAATHRQHGIAAFSNYGYESVHVAAPGVNIESLIPDDGKMKMSGTSQAAPFVANVASEIMKTNNRLVAFEVKKILMETVDHKSFLVGKVASAGIVNAERAVLAAQLALDRPLNEAITTSFKLVIDAGESVVESLTLNTIDYHGFVFPLPSPY